jgi:hypothetical protein
MDENTVTLFRPVGQKEMDHIKDTGYREFPPRLPSQPIFYPVSNREYAAQIAREWNTRDPRSGYVGYVTNFAFAPSFSTDTRSKPWAAQFTRSTGSPQLS